VCSLFKQQIFAILAQNQLRNTRVSQRRVL
jgi:hypothetical protein